MLRNHFFFHIIVGFTAICLLPLAGAETAHALRHKLQKHKTKTAPTWYVGLTGSVAFVSDADYNETGGVSPLNGTIEYEDGYGLTGAVGYRFNRGSDVNLRVEGELGIRQNNMERFISTTNSVTNLTDDIEVKSSMVNGYLDFPLGGGWRPYVGAGVGAANVKIDSADLAVSDNDTVFAYQGMVGIYYQPPSMKQLEIGVGYRYFDIGDPDFTTSNVSGSTSEIEYDSHNLEAGARIYF